MRLAARSNSIAPVHDPAQIAQAIPAPAQRFVAPAGGQAGGTGADARSPPPRRPRAHQASSAVKQQMGASHAVRQEKRWSSTVRQARRRGLSRPVAIKRILARVEIEGREIDGAEIVQRREQLWKS